MKRTYSMKIELVVDYYQRQMGLKSQLALIWEGSSRAVFGVDWPLNSTTTDGIMSMAKSVVFGSRIELRVCKWDGNVFYEDLYQIFKSKSIYEQIYANLNTWDSWEKVQVCSDRIVLCDVVKGESESEFDTECKKAIANAEAERPGESIFLSVRVRDPDLVELVDHPGELSMRDLQKRLPPEWERLIFKTVPIRRRPM